MSTIDDLIVQAEAQHPELPPGLLASLLNNGERSGSTAVSPKGAVGRAQLMPATAASLGVTDATDDTQAIPAAARYLAGNVKKYGVAGGVAAYNAGPGAVEAHGGIPPYPETQAYVKRVTGALDGSDIFGAAPQTSAAPAAAEPPDGSDIFADKPADAPSSPAAPDSPYRYTHTGEPLNPAQTAFYKAMEAKNGGLDIAAEPGSKALPYAFHEGTKAEPGKWYVDLQGNLQQAAGGDSPVDGAVQGALGDVGKGLGTSLSNFGQDLVGHQKEANDALMGDVANYGKGLPFIRDAQLAMDGLNTVVGAPVKAAIDTFTRPVETVSGGRIPHAPLTDALSMFAPFAGELGAARSVAKAAEAAGMSQKAYELLNAQRDATTSALGRPTPSGPPGSTASADDQAKAAKLVRGKLAAGGIRTPADVDTKLAANFAGDPNVTAAELAGRQGTGLVTHLARRSSEPFDTADHIENVIDARVAANPQHALDMVKTHLGVDPEQAAASMDQLEASGREAATPLWDEAWAHAPPDPTRTIQSEATPDDPNPRMLPSIEDLFRRPDIAEGRRIGLRVAQMEGVSPEDLGLVHMDTVDPGLPTGGASAHADVDFTSRVRQAAASAPSPSRGFKPGEIFETPGAGLTPTESQLVATLRRDGGSELRQGPSLIKHLADNGGLADPGGELATLDADKWHVGKAYQTKLIQPGGRSLEDSAPLFASESGYFPELGEQTATREHLMDAIRQELAGKKRFADVRYDPARLDKVRALDDVQERLDRLGLDAKTNSDAEVGAAFARDSAQPHTLDEYEYGAAPGPNVEPVLTAVPNWRQLDYTRRGMGVLIERKYTDHATGQLLDNDEARAAARNYKLFTDTLDAHNPQMRAARLASFGYKGPRGSYRWAKGQLDRGDVHDFTQRFAAMTPGEQDGVRMGLGHAVLQKVERGALRNGKFDVPGVRQKLDLAFGPIRAEAFAKAMNARSRMNKTGSRMAPGVNSTTAEALGHNPDAAGLEAAAEGAGLVARAASGHGIVPLAAKGVQYAASRIRTAGQSPGVRDTAARLLMMPPQDLKAFLAKQPAVASGPRASVVRQSPAKAIGAGVTIATSAANLSPKARELLKRKTSGKSPWVEREPSSAAKRLLARSPL